MAKYMIETKRSDNKAKYLANVYLLKVKGMERTGNEEVRQRHEAADRRFCGGSNPFLDTDLSNLEE